MKKFFIIPIFARWYLLALFLSFTNDSLAVNYTNQNYLITRAPGKDIFMRDAGWYEIKRDAENKRNCWFSGAFQISLFYQKLNNIKDVGAYFGIKGKGQGITYQGGYVPNIDLDSEEFVHDALRDGYEFPSNLVPDKIFRYQKATATTPAQVVQLSVSGGTPDIDPLTNKAIIGPTTQNGLNLASALELFSANVANLRAMAGAINLNVDQRVWGALLSYYFYTQTNLWYGIDVPLLRIKNTLTLQVKGSPLIDPELSRDVTMDEVLTGIYQLPATFVGPNNDNPNAQDALRFAKFAVADQVQSGLGDVDLTLGYRLADHEKLDIDVYVKLSMPTSKMISPEFMFPPQLGNNGHVSLGLGGCFSCDFWQGGNWTFEGIMNNVVNYSFARTQQRTLSAFVDRGVLLPWDKYILVHQVNTTGPLEPLANILTLDVKVEPGFNSETCLALGARGCNLLANLGVCIFARQGEQVTLGKWGSNGNYGRPGAVGYRTTENFLEASYPFEDLDITTITKDKVQTSIAATPGSVSANIFAQVGYYPQSASKRPLNLCLGVAYEACNENSALGHFSVWLKLGFAF